MPHKTPKTQQSSSRRSFLLKTPALAAATAAGASLTSAQGSAKGLGLGANKPALYTRAKARRAAAANNQAVTSNDSDLTTGSPPFPDNPLLGAIVHNRLGFGPKPGDVASFNLLGSTDAERIDAYLAEQLNPRRVPGSKTQFIGDDEVNTRLNDPGFTTLEKPLPQLWNDHILPEILPWEERIRPAQETAYATFVRATYSKYQLFEVLADFWHNHFNVYAYDDNIHGTFVNYDRDIIRPHVLGNFYNMLVANAKSTGMLYYLDNYNSQAGGANENYARELLELHTLGSENYLGSIPPQNVPVDAHGRRTGYVENDVFELAKCLTGWSVNNGHWSDSGDTDDGTFRFRTHWHDYSEKLVLGQVLAAEQDPPPTGASERLLLAHGLRVMQHLAEHPGTAKFICRKLCQRLISDNPPQSIIDSSARVFHMNWRALNQLKIVADHIVRSQEFMSTGGDKVKRPFETATGAMRACEADVTPKPYDDNTNTFRWMYEPTGQALFEWSPPNGYPDVAAIWQGTTPLVMSWRLLNRMLRMQDANDNFIMDVVTTTLNSFPPPGGGQLNSNWTPNILAGFWFERILGYPPNASQVQTVANMMTHPDAYIDDTNPPQWDLDTPVDISVDDQWPLYWRSGLRTMVGLILMSPEFLKR